MSNQIIGIDISNGTDNSCASIVCGCCHSILKIHQYSPKDVEFNVTLFKECPRCGIQFKKWIINS